MSFCCRFLLLFKKSQFIWTFTLLIAVSTILSLSEAAKASPKDSINFIESLLSKNPEMFSKVLANQEKYQTQICYTSITRDAKNRPHFTTYSYHLDEYFFYAASWMKFPLAIFTLEKLERLKIDRKNILKIKTQCGYAQEEWQEARLINPCSFAQIITEAMVVSNNAAYNLMFDFLGADSINSRFRQLGYKKAVICNRFSGCDSIGHSTCNAFEVQDATTKKPILQQTVCYLKKPYRSTFKLPFFGSYHFESGVLMNGPKDFSQRNYIPLSEMHRFITEFFFPNATKSKMHLSKSNEAFMKKAMRLLPRNCPRPKYNESSFPDAYMKPLLIGGTNNRLPNSIKIYNKVGQYFGWTCDNAYVLDTTNKVEFIVSVVLFTNNKDIVNDDPIAYQQIAIPFISNLGKIFYNYEKDRNKRY